jgi:FMN-dependent NADH-azoreductase
MTPARPTLNLLHIDSSARFGRGGIEPHGSWSRRLTDTFARRWREARPQDRVTHRDLAAQPPQPMARNWVQAAFTQPTQRAPALDDTLAESDRLVAELREADVLVIGLPMYNYGMPAPLKAWADLVVRVGKTVDVRRDAGTVTYHPLLADRPRRAVLLSSRGAEGFGPGGEYAALNHADPALRGVLEFIGITDIETLALEGEEKGDAAFEASVAATLAQVESLAARWADEATAARAAQPA